MMRAREKQQFRETVHGLTVLIEAAEGGIENLHNASAAYADLAAKLREEDAPAFLIEGIAKQAALLKQTANDWTDAAMTARLCLP